MYIIYLLVLWVLYCGYFNVQVTAVGYAIMTTRSLDLNYKLGHCEFYQCFCCLAYPSLHIQRLEVLQEIWTTDDRTGLSGDDHYWKYESGDQRSSDSEMLKTYSTGLMTGKIFYFAFYWQHVVVLMLATINKLRAFRVSPMFLLHALSFITYSAIGSFTRMCIDREKFLADTTCWQDQVLHYWRLMDVNEKEIHNVMDMSAGNGLYPSTSGNIFLSEFDACEATECHSIHNILLLVVMVLQ
ncbi:hypothetical protein RDI58_017802 [Solanum bulbocastanum]|uniref:Uncharacterized protein n=1 Tax=Solanum bulbocastanum TaxID=147425 RepID=A0AAN8Y9J0_SOLBU